VWPRRANGLARQHERHTRGWNRNGRRQLGPKQAVPHRMQYSPHEPANEGARVLALRPLVVHLSAGKHSDAPTPTPGARYRTAAADHCAAKPAGTAAAAHGSAAANAGAAPAAGAPATPAASAARQLRSLSLKSNKLEHSAILVK